MESWPASLPFLHPAECDKLPFASFFARKFVPDGVWSSGYEFV